MLVAMLMGGKSQRFFNQGYQIEKAFLPMGSKKRNEETIMVLSSLEDLPIKKEDSILWVIRREHKRYPQIKLLKEYPSSSFFELQELTNGQATSAFLALESSHNLKQDVLIAGCDCGMLVNETKFVELKTKADVIVFTYKNQPSILESAKDHSYIVTDDNEIITQVYLKEVASDNPLNDYVISSTFWFKSIEVYNTLYDQLVESQMLINREYYIDSMVGKAIESHYKVMNYPLNYCFDYGTPLKYENYIKSQKYFNEFFLAYHKKGLM
jgi:hypothetical protein